MRRALLPLFLLGALVVALGLAWITLTSGVGAGGQERLPSQALEVGAFRSLEVEGHAEVILVQGQRQAVEVEGGSGRRARIRVRVDDGKLYVGAGTEAPWWSVLFGGASSRPPRVTVRFRTLETIALSGAVRLTADEVRVAALAVRASGTATVRIATLEASALRFAGSGAVSSELAGRATEQEIAISGAGSYRAGQLLSERADVKVSGAGRVVVNASRQLDASISGAGAIDYVGDPQVRQNISGAGRIKRIPSAREALARGRAVTAAVNAPGTLPGACRA